MKFAASQQIVLPATSVLEDEGRFSGNKSNPTSWGEGDRSLAHAAIVTLDPVVFTKGKRCADVNVKMLKSALYDELSAAASNNHVYNLIDVLDFPIPANRPKVEFGKLVDDIGVRAVLLTDVADAIPAEDKTLSDGENAERCRDGAQQLAVHMKAALGSQTSIVVVLGDVPAVEASYGCPLGPKNAPDMYVAWDKSPVPPAKTADFIADAGAFLTGASSTEIRQEIAACVSKALNPSSSEMADREFRGVKIECQAFRRDGGGGSATVYRRFGAYPDRPAATDEELSALARASDAQKARDQTAADDALAFAKWWQDPTIPQRVKTFAMMTARQLALSEKCPAWKPDYAQMSGQAADAGIAIADLQPDGKYFSLMTQMLAAMRAGTSQESVDEACQEARSYGSTK